MSKEYAIKPAVPLAAPAMSRAEYARAEIARVRDALEERGWDDERIAAFADVDAKDGVRRLEPGEQINSIGVAEIRFGAPGQPGLYGFSRYPRPPARPPEPTLEERVASHLRSRRFA